MARDALDLLLCTVPACPGLCGEGVLDVVDLGTISEPTDEDPTPPELEEDTLRRSFAADALIRLLGHWAAGPPAPWTGAIPELPAVRFVRVTVPVAEIIGWSTTVRWAIPSARWSLLRMWARDGLLPRQDVELDLDAERRAAIA